MKALQAALGVTADGKAGPKTAAALKAHLERAGIIAGAWGRMDSVILDVTGFAEKGASAKLSGKPVVGDWMAVAASVLGQHEDHDADELDAWLASDGEWAHRANDIPWCGEFVATSLALSGHKNKLKNPLGARNWMAFGEPCKPKFGSIMVFWRGRKDGWQGHVGFYVGEEAGHYHILGGNQGNKVSVARIAKSRFLGARWPVDAADPKPFTVKPGMTTVNEA